MPAQPQDHKDKKKDRLFSFAGADGETYTLPLASEARTNMSGADAEDAVLGGEMGMTAFLVKCLRASGADPKALAALRAMTAGDYFKTLNQWGEFGDGDGASLGE